MSVRSNGHEERALTVLDGADLGRLKSLAERCINQLELSLEGVTVYTEAASGPYVFDPVLAAMSGARRVYAVTADSSYATSADVERATMEAAAFAGVADRILVTTQKFADQLGESDIITNSGFVRPIDATTLRSLKATAVVPLMWETWEFRDSDLDLDACQSLGILVMGTDEGRPPFPMYSYVGLLALKLLFELGLDQDIQTCDQDHATTWMPQ